MKPFDEIKYLTQQTSYHLHHTKKLFIVIKLLKYLEKLIQKKQKTKNLVYFHTEYDS